MKLSSPELTGIDGMVATPYSHDNVRRGVTHYVFGRGLSAVVGFLTVILLVRHMDVSSYASYTALLGLCIVVGMLSGLGMERALTRFIPEGVMVHAGSPLKYFIWSISAARLLVLFTLLVSLYFSWHFLTVYFTSFSHLSQFPIALAAMVACSAMFQLFSAVMQGLVQQKMLTRILVVQWGGRLLLILAILSTHTDISLDQALWLMAVPDAFGTIILIWAIHRYLTTLSSKKAVSSALEQGPVLQSEAWPPWRQVASLSLNNYGYNLLSGLPQGSSMILLVAALLSPPFVAVYGFYISLIERCRQYLPLHFMLNLAEPVLIAGYVRSGNFARLCHHSRLLYKLNLLLLLPALAWLAAAAAPLTHILTGGKYTEYAWVLALLLAQIALGGHATILQIIINAVGKSRILTISGCAALCAMAVLISVALLSHEYMWLIAAPLIYELVNNFIAVALLGKYGWPYDLQWVFHGKLLLTTAMAYLGAEFASEQIHSLLGKVLLAGVVALVLFGLGIVFLRALNRDELYTLRGILKPAKNRDSKAADQEFSVRDEA